MKYFSLCTILLFGAVQLLAQPNINNELAPNTFPNPANPRHLHVAPSDSVYRTDHNNENFDGVKYGTYSQDTSGSAFKGMTVPVSSKDGIEGEKNGIIVTEEKKSKK